MNKDNIYVELLKGARARIELRQSGFICCALDSVAKSDTWQHAKRIETWINATIGDGPCGALEDWLIQRGLIADMMEQTYTDCELQEQMRLYRLRWIDEVLIPLWSTVEVSA